MPRPPTPALADHGIGVLIGEPEAREDADALAVGHAIGQVERPVAGILDEQVLPPAPVECPGVVLLFDRQLLARVVSRGWWKLDEAA